MSLDDLNNYSNKTKLIIVENEEMIKLEDAYENWRQEKHLDNVTFSNVVCFLEEMSQLDVETVKALRPFFENIESSEHQFFRHLGDDSDDLDNLGD